MRIISKASLIILSVLVLFSCGKKDAPKAKITVVNSYEQAKDLSVEGAIVTLFAEHENGIVAYAQPSDGKEPAIKEFKKVAGSDGTCEFTTKYDNILKVKAELPYSGDTLYGQSVVVLEEGKVAEVKVHLRKLKSLWPDLY